MDLGIRTDRSSSAILVPVPAGTDMKKQTDSLEGGCGQLRQRGRGLRMAGTVGKGDSGWRRRRWRSKGEREEAIERERGRIEKKSAANRRRPLTVVVL